MDNRDTTPAPSDPEARLGRQLAELELALARVGELVSQVHHTVALIKLGVQTTECQVHTIREAKRNDRRWLIDLERRVRDLEAQGSAAE